MESDNGKATLLSCFKRSLMFKTVAHLSDMDSGTLFLKGVVAKYLVLLFITELANLFCGEFSVTNVVMLALFGTLVEIVIVTPITLLFAFIFNLFLADNFMKVANIIVFSGVYSPLSRGVVVAFPESTLSSILGMISLVAFVVLLVMNVRALGKK